MDISLQEIRSHGARDTFSDIASIIAVILIGLVVFALANPRFRTDVDTVWLHQGTQSSHVTQGTLAP